jgi:L-alanine-DL-glutamate epimerase-like enolase superfamily enzyme
MGMRLRNAGRPGIGFCALSAVDLALWDLKARVLELPLADVVGRARDATPVYGSGGFTSYSLERIREQLGGWVANGIPRVKMKVSREPDRDPERLDAARQAIGDEAELYVDSNGALSRTQALRWAERFAREFGPAEPPGDHPEAAAAPRPQPGFARTGGRTAVALGVIATLAAAGGITALRFR